MLDKANDAKPFDLEAWLSQSSLPEGLLTIYGNAAATARIDELTKRIDREADGRLAASMTKERDKLIESVKASALEVRIRALTDAAADELDAAHPRPGSDVTPAEVAAWDNAYAEDMLARMAVEPVIDAAGWAAIRGKVTGQTWASLKREAAKVNALVVADAPFWRELSRTNPD